MSTVASLNSSELFPMGWMSLFSAIFYLFAVIILYKVGIYDAYYVVAMFFVPE